MDVEEREKKKKERKDRSGGEYGLEYGECLRTDKNTVTRENFGMGVSAK